MNTAFPSLSAFLNAAEGRILHHQANAVDTHHAALEFACNAHCLVNVLREHASHEPEIGVVRERHNLLLRLEGLDDADGAEDLFTVDFRCWIDVNKDGRLNKVALVVWQSAYGFSSVLGGATSL